MIRTSPLITVRLLFALSLASLFSVHTSASAQSLKVLSAGAFKPVVVAIAPAFEARTGIRLDIDNDTAGGLLRRVRAGEAFDLIIAPPATIKALGEDGRIQAEATQELARVAIGVAVRQGSPRPTIGTPEQFRDAVLNARRPAYIDPKAGGSSGIYLDGLFERWGIAEAVRAKAVLVPGGLVAERLVSGEADLAIHQISEILPVKGVELVGPLPDSIQNLTIYAAAPASASPSRAAARELIETLRSMQAAQIIRDKGMSPAP